jgi:nitrous oxidase accessory protein
MSRKLVFALSLFVLLSSSLYARFNSVQVRSSNGYPVHNLDTHLNYTAIQEAIDAPETLDGHTIFVEAGIYYENIVVSKAIRLVGENRNITILDGSKVDKVAKVAVDNVSIIGFAIQNSGSEWQHDFGVDLTSRRNCRVENCTIQNHAYAVYLAYAVNNTIVKNIIANASSYAIMIKRFSRDNNVTNNTLIHNKRGVEIEEDCEGNIIAYNNISLTNYYAIYLLRSNANFVLNNLLSFNGYSNPPLIYAGIELMYSNNNTLANNLIFNNTGGILFYFDGGSKPARHNIIMNNTIENNDYGVIINYGGNQSHPSTGTYNQLCENTLQSNDYGIYLIGSDHNTFYHNNFLGSIYKEVVSVNSTNTWDSNFEGNYWSDYNGTDSDHDGIGDTSYFIDEDSQDNYPLMGTFSSHGVSPHFGEGLAVTMVSNSTISDFTVARIIPIPVINITASSYDLWNETGETRMIMFNLTGDSGLGFCRICIPKALMCPPYTVALNRGPGSPVYYNETLFNNGTHRWIYFTYPHSLTHPLIANVTQHPDKDNIYPDDKVVVYANVTDDLSGVKRVILNSTTNNGTWFSKEMRNLDGDIWNATIPPFPYQTNITHVISAEDNVNNYVTTEGTVYECQYQVIPEFPSFLILLLFMIATLLAVIIYKRKYVTW